MLSLILLELTVQEVIADIPRDAGAVLVLLLTAVFVGFIWHGSRGAPPVDLSLLAEDALDPLHMDADAPSQPAAEAVAPPEPVSIDPAALYRGPDFQRVHAEAR